MPDQDLASAWQQAIDLDAAPLAQPGEQRSRLREGGVAAADASVAPWAPGCRRPGQDVEHPPPPSCALREAADEWLAELKRLVLSNDDVFPIPWLPPPPAPAGRGRRTRARHAQCLAIREVAERAWLSLNETGANVPVQARSREGRPCRLKTTKMQEQHQAIWGRIMRESRRVWHSRRASLRGLPTGAELIVDMVKVGPDLYRENAGAAKYVE